MKEYCGSPEDERGSQTMKMTDNIIFRGVNENELKKIDELGLLETCKFIKNQVIARVGDKLEKIGILNYGKLYIEHIDLWGNRIILHDIKPGQIFGEAYVDYAVPLMVNVIAEEESEVVFFYKKTFNEMASVSPGLKIKILNNALYLASKKNIIWSQKMLSVSAKNIRTRVMKYLSNVAMEENSKIFTIPFNRQEMADYLNVDRSALSKELSKMQDDGLISYYKNTFKIIHE